MKKMFLAVAVLAFTAFSVKACDPVQFVTSGYSTSAFTLNRQFVQVAPIQRVQVQQVHVAPVVQRVQLVQQVQVVPVVQRVQFVQRVQQVQVQRVVVPAAQQIIVGGRRSVVVIN